ncbi:MAG: methylmalonyl Co-A mutase-associated GTPase MeaB [Candidatus Cloacimonadota bacterium]|nr:methylmalonyl Co-A mutase-associated GTPase MeaB [Candidatus Cloacimonadota bacterium]
MKIKEQTENLIKGDFRAAAKLITCLDDKKMSAEIIKLIHPYRKKNYVIGITGAPGAGKSTLTDKLIRCFRKQDKTVGVIAVDPTSPFSGGAVLGDRIRLQDHATDEKVFIRSMGTRGHLGGLSSATNNAITILSVLGCDVIILETVGVGQSEVEVMKVADSVILILTPEIGDSIQIMKAGIMEIGDIFVVNKSDRLGKDRIVSEIKMMRELSNKKTDYQSTIIETVANKNEGIENLFKEILLHKDYLYSTNLIDIKRKNRIEKEIENIINDKILEEISAKMLSKEDIAQIVDKVYNKEIDPFTMANVIIENYISKNIIDKR